MLAQYQMPPGPATCQAPRNLGISIVFLSNGTVALVPTSKLCTIDLVDEDMLGIFDKDGFMFLHKDGRTEDHNWGAMIRYQHNPLFLLWLQSLQLQNPF